MSISQATGAVFVDAGRPLEVRRFELPTLGTGEILVRVAACTLCASDLHTYTGRRKSPAPSILGHEIIGHIAALGPDSPRVDQAGETLSVGDRVTWSVVASCGECFYCRRDLPQKCAAMMKYGHEALRAGRELTGGLADYCVLAQGTAIVRLPGDLPDAVVCPASCATATVSAALRIAGEVRARSVLVQGAGLLGLTACAQASAMRASQVICCDMNRARLDRAREFGATHTATPDELSETVRQATEGYGVDVALEITGAPAAFVDGLAQLRLGGTYVLVGAVYTAPPVPISVESLVRRQLTLRGVHNYAPQDLLAAVRFLDANRQFPFASLVSDWLPLAEADRAFHAAEEAAALRIGVRMTAT
ncbi:MAG: zinc-binding dehydrogenase [Pirellulales bacterium]|nr:zinc-binding dehydrogenase [Pirellulales bacterium]